MLTGPVEPLKKSANGWAPSKDDSQEVKFKKTINSILNKMTREKVRGCDGGESVKRGVRGAAKECQLRGSKLRYQGVGVIMFWAHSRCAVSTSGTRVMVGGPCFQQQYRRSWVISLISRLCCL